MTWVVLALSNNGEAEALEFSKQEFAEQSFSKRVRADSDRYITLLACEGKTCTPLRTYCNQSNNTQEGII